MSELDIRDLMRETNAEREIREERERLGIEPPWLRTRASESVESVAEKTDSLAETERNGLTDSALKESVRPESVPRRVVEESGTDSDPESVADSERPFSLPIREFVELPREHREPLLASTDGRAVVGRHSLTLLGALGGHGKTTLFVDLALHLAAGLDYPPFTVPRPVSILIIENEGPEELFAAKLDERLKTFTHDLKARLDVCTFDWGGFTIADDKQRVRLTQEITDKGYDLVFGDPLDSLGIEGVGSPEDTRKFLALMKQTGLNKRTAWWLNTHPRKEETKEALNEISGAWGGKPDSVFLLRMLADDRTQIRQPKLRWAKRGKGPTLLMAFDAETEAFTFLGEESEVERDYVAEVTGLLADGRWRIAKEIAAPKETGGIGANVDTIKAVLEEHPDMFDSRTGDAAKAIGRSSQATLWQLREAQENVA
jgi:AAA domain